MTKKNSVEKFIDYAVFAPIGAIKLASDAVAHASEVGKATFDSKTAMARAVGKIATEYGSRQIHSQFALTSRQFVEKYFNQNINLNHSGPYSDKGENNTMATKDKATVPDLINNRIGTDKVQKSVDSDQLGIASYDTLAASQVISRLDGLQQDQLRLIFSYELDHRKRRTVLAKLEALLT